MSRDDARPATKHKAAGYAVPDVVIVNAAITRRVNTSFEKSSKLSFHLMSGARGRSANARRWLAICLKTSNKRLAPCGSKRYAESARFQL
jgi:hypothetical protein